MDRRWREFGDWWEETGRAWLAEHPWAPALLVPAIGLVRIIVKDGFDGLGVLLITFGWVPALALAWWAGGAAGRLEQRLRARRLERLRENQICPHCGYDLRATPDRCPECGRCPEEAEAE